MKNLKEAVAIISTFFTIGTGLTTIGSAIDKDFKLAFFLLLGFTWSLFSTIALWNSIED